MFRAGIIGLGKMGLSHQSIVNSHPEVNLVAIADSNAYVLDTLSKYTGVNTYTDYRKMLAEQALDCVFIATPSKYHIDIVSEALDRGLHVFCEKPFGIDPERAYRLAEIAESKGLVNQVGYHYRFVAAFNEAKRLLEQELIGELHHIRAEAYGPVVLRTKGSSWRSQKGEGGGCLFDYACHAIDLIHYLVGMPVEVSGTVLNSVFSDDVDDEIYSTLHFSKTFHGQLATNWSDESFRKMSVKIEIWGTRGRIIVDRQEVQIYLRQATVGGENLSGGWNVRYTTELTKPVWFYLRGEEYSAQIDHFFHCIRTNTIPMSSFRSAADTGLVAASLRADARQPRTTISRPSAETAVGAGPAHGTPPKSFVRNLLDRF